MITAEGVTKRFGSFAAIEDVTFHVERGEIVGFLGPNGAGKSTAMRILAGVFPPTHGRAAVAGHDVVSEPLQARSAVGYFPERVCAYLDMSVGHYLSYVGEMKGLRRRAARLAGERAMEDCGLGSVGRAMIGTLSKGFRQRVGIAQALVGHPRVLILDEPTAGLDPEQVAEMRSLILGLRGERTVILSTHILSEVEATCDRVIILHRGRVLAVDTPAALNRRLRRSSQIRLRVRGPEAAVLDHLRSIPGVLAAHVAGRDEEGLLGLTADCDPGRDLREELAAAVVARGWGLAELHYVTLSLEEIFLSLVASDASPESRHEDLRDLPA
jgi:ABC-2 type transport system ATP-binding protein